MDITKAVKRNNFALAQYDSKYCCIAQIGCFQAGGVPRRHAPTTGQSSLAGGSDGPHANRIEQHLDFGQSVLGIQAGRGVIRNKLALQGTPGGDRRLSVPALAGITLSQDGNIFLMDKSSDCGDAAVRKEIES